MIYGVIQEMLINKEKKRPRKKNSKRNSFYDFKGGNF
jgi:hypothetical protein